MERYRDGKEVKGWEKSDDVTFRYPARTYKGAPGI